MGMLLYMMDTALKNKAKEATEQVAPKPTHNESHIEVKEVPPETKEKEKEKKLTVTRAEIMKMNAATVKAFAKEQGVDNVDEMSGAEVKRILCDKLFEESE